MNVCPSLWEKTPKVNLRQCILRAKSGTASTEKWECHRRETWGIPTRQEPLIATYICMHYCRKGSALYLIVTNNSKIIFVSSRASHVIMYYSVFVDACMVHLGVWIILPVTSGMTLSIQSICLTKCRRLPRKSRWIGLLFGMLKNIWYAVDMCMFWSTSRLQARLVSLTTV